MEVPLDGSYTTLETFTDGMDVPDQVLETKMTQEQVKTFEEDWSNLWNPQAKVVID